MGRASKGMILGLSIPALFLTLAGAAPERWYMWAKQEGHHSGKKVIKRLDPVYPSKRECVENIQKSVQMGLKLNEAYEPVPFSIEGKPRGLITLRHGIVMTWECLPEGESMK